MWLSLFGLIHEILLFDFQYVALITDQFLTISKKRLVFK